MTRIVCAASFALYLLAGALPLSAHADETKLEADRHAKEGATHFRVGEFDEAAAEYKAAYRLSGDAAHLILVGDCYVELKKWDEALFYYQGALKDHPDTPHRAKVEEAIAMIEGILVEEAMRPVEPESGPSSAPTADSELERRRVEVEVNRIDARLRTAETLKLVGIVATAAGGASIVLGIVIGAGLRIVPAGVVLGTLGFATAAAGVPMWIVFAVRTKKLKRERDAVMTTTLRPWVSPVPGGLSAGVTLSF